MQSRRTLTLIFADIRAVGSDDATVARRAVLRCFDEARAVLEHHGAVVEKFIGDAVMAVFGLDRRREDDALRAVRAGLDMQQRIAAVSAELERSVGVAIEARIGINTGPVIAGDPALGQRLVTGDAVNVAARLEQAAGPGDVLIGALTKRLCGAGVVVDDVAPLPLKGKAQPVAASRVLQVLSAGVDVRRPSVPMIGRESELARLKSELQAALTTSSLRRVDVCGEAGSGKSRLVNEFLDEASSIARVVRTLCLPYGEGITFWPIVDMIGQLSGIEAADDRASALRKLDDLSGAPDIALRLATLFGLADDPFPLSELFWAVRRLLERVGAARPLVIVIDGLHSAEPTLIELLVHLGAHVSNAAVLLITMTRPDDDGDDPAVADRIVLRALDDGAVEELLRLNLDGDVAVAVSDQVVRVSGGNPLFVEQFAIMLVEGGRLQRRANGWELTGSVGQLDGPPTIEALLAARIDALTADERATLEPASIVGREFPRAAVNVLAEKLSEDSIVRALVDLGRRRLVAAARDPDLVADHRFANLMIRDVVYAGLLKRTRASWHEGFATWLEQVLGARIAEHAEVIGYHLEQSFHFRRQLGEQDRSVADVGERAFRYLAPAGDRAFVRGDMSAAGNLLARAASTLPQDVSERNRTLIQAGEARVHTGAFGEAVGHFDDAEASARNAGDTVTAAAAELARATLRFRIGDGVDDAAARALVQRLQPLFAAAGDHGSDARCWRLLAYAELTNSQWGAAERAMRALIDRARLAGDTVLELRVLPGLVGFALHGPTPVNQAIATAVELREATASDRRARALTERYLGHLLALDGRGEEGRVLCTNARNSLLELGWNFEAALVSIDLGPVELTLGRAEEAERVLREDYESLRAMGEQNYVSTTAALLGEAVRRQGRLEEAIELTEFSAASASLADVLTQAVWREVNASALAGLGRLDEAEVRAREALSLVLDTDGLSSHGEAYITLAEILYQAGRLAEAVEASTRAQACFYQKGHLPGRDRVAALVAQLRG